FFPPLTLTSITLVIEIVQRYKHKKIKKAGSQLIFRGLLKFHFENNAISLLEIKFSRKAGMAKQSFFCFDIGVNPLNPIPLFDIQTLSPAPPYTPNNTPAMAQKDTPSPTRSAWKKFSAPFPQF